MTERFSLNPFEPLFWARGGHAQTVLGHLLNRPKGSAQAVSHLVPLSDGDQLLMLEDRPEEAPRACAMLMHGLGGDASARYMLSAAARLTERGFVVFRLNHRAAGEGAGLTRRTYHSGLTGDVRATTSVIRTLYPELPLTAVGFSMSGNILLKYLAEEGHGSPLAGAMAVNPPIDLALCMAALEARENRLYHRRFTRLLNHLVENNARRADAAPLFETSRARSVREFDTRVTAPTWGFDSAEHYYESESACRLVHRIQTPTMVLTADDDPVVPVSTFRELTWPEEAALHITRGGGHMGYVAAAKSLLGDRGWLDRAIADVAPGFIE